MSTQVFHVDCWPNAGAYCVDFVQHLATATLAGQQPKNHHGRIALLLATLDTSVHHDADHLLIGRESITSSETVTHRKAYWARAPRASLSAIYYAPTHLTSVAARRTKAYHLRLSSLGAWQSNIIGYECR